MIDPKRNRRALGISLVVITISTGNYSRLTGIENIRAIHVVSLLTIGAAIGIFLVNAMMLLEIRRKNRNDNTPKEL